MWPFLRYGLPAAWLLVVAYRGVFNASDQAGRVALGVLTLGVIVIAVMGMANFIEERARAKRRGESVFKSSTMRGMLVMALIGGFLLRFVLGGGNPGGVVARAGGVVGMFALGGLFVLGFVTERARAKNPSFYFDPNWKYGLLLVCIVAMAVIAVPGPKGAAASVSVVLFWLALIILAIQTGGRWSLILRGREPRSGVTAR